MDAFFDALKASLAGGSLVWLVAAAVIVVVGVLALAQRFGDDHPVLGALLLMILLAAGIAGVDNACEPYHQEQVRRARGW